MFPGGRVGLWPPPGIRSAFFLGACARLPALAVEGKLGLRISRTFSAMSAGKVLQEILVQNSLREFLVLSSCRRGVRKVFSTRFRV